MSNFVQEQRRASNVVDILLAEHRLGHSREVGEFVDHPAKVGSLAEVSGSDATSPPYRRCSRSAASWIGVSGFLISWAMRRAMSDQAARRWSASCSVMSSKVSTAPSW